MIKKSMYVLCSLVAVIISLFMCDQVAAASLPKTITGVTQNGDLSYNGYDQLVYKKYGDGVLFCTQFHISGIGSSCTLSSSQWSQPTQAGVAAIINKYNSSPSEKSYYYAELAINEFLYYYETKDSTNLISDNRDVRNNDGVKDFYDVAVAAYNNAKESFEVKLSTESGKITFKLDDDYYISNKLTVSGVEDYDVKVSGTDNVEVYNQKNNSFYVRFPSSSLKDGETITVSVDVTASKTISLAKKYDCGTNNQDLTPNKLDSTTIDKSAKMTGSISKEKQTTKLKISKQDITTKEELPGATLVLKDENGKEVETWVSTNEPHYIEGLEPGKYSLTETIAPEGYKLSEDTIEFTLEADGNVKEVIMYNTHVEKYKVKISKQDITTKEELPGATLVVKDAEGNEIARFVSGEEPHYLELEAGEYILTEIQAPDGYDLSYEVIKFTVGENGEVETYVVMYNSKTPDTADKNIILIVGSMLIAVAGIGFSILKIRHQKRLGN